MKITIYAMYTRLRSWDTTGQIFTSAKARTESLRAFVEELDEDNHDDDDDDCLLDIVSNHDHEVYLFEEEIEIDAAPATRDMIRCEPCCGMGYKGRYRQTARGKQWKIETCRACGGCGEREPRRQRKKARR